MMFKEKFMTIIVVILAVVMTIGMVSFTPAMAAASYTDTELVQNDNRKILSNEMSKNSLTIGAIQRDIERFLGDKKAVVLPHSVPPAKQTM